nr:hypothetical protein [Tanacetum cinerariifolium]
MVRPNGQAPRTIKELCQPSINGRGEQIAPIPIQATDFCLQNHMIQQVQNACQIHGLPNDDANRHIDKFLEITQHMKQNGVSDDAIRLSLFPSSLTHNAIAWYDRLPRNSIHSFNDMMRKFLSKYIFLLPCHQDTINAAAGGTFMQKTPEECYDLIENMTAHHNHWDTSAIRDETSRNISSTSTTKTVNTKCETCGGPHSFTECPAVGGYTQETAYATTGRVNNFNQAPTFQAPSHQPQFVSQVSDFQAYMKANDAVMKNMQTQMTSLTNSNLELKNMFGQFMKMNTASSLGTGSLPSNTVPNPREDLKVITTQGGVTLAGPSVSPPPPPFSMVVNREPETITDQVLTGSTNNIPPLVVQPSSASTSFFTISSSKMPEVTKDTIQPSIQPLVGQTQVPIDEPIVASKPKPTIPYPSRVNKQKLREKDDNLALKFVKIFRNLYFELSFADALLHMPKFALMFKSLLNNKEKLFDLATTPMNENCSSVILKKLPEKLGDPSKFLIPCDFTEFDECLALADLAITFKVGQTSKYTYNDAESINRVDVIDVAYEEYVQQVLGFSDNSKSSNPTPISDPIISLSSPSLTPFEGCDFILEEIEACLTSKSIPPGIDDIDFDMEGDICILEELLSKDPSSSPLPLKELNVEEIKIVKSSIDEPSELELKELSSHLEYAFLERTDKLPVIISKELKDEEKSAFLKVLKSHKRAIAHVLKVHDGHLSRYDRENDEGAKNLTADHLSRLENPHQDELEKKEITETFPFEILGMIAFRGDSTIPWITSDLEASRACGFVHRPLELQSLAYGNMIS